jgi:hypothetical protein
VWEIGEVGNLSEGDHLEDPGVDERIVLKWIDLAEDGYTWRAVVNVEMNFWVL